MPSLAARMAELEVPGVSIAVIHRGRIEWARGFGVTEKGGGPVAADTLFQAASISKPVFALGVLHLVDAGKLQLDTNVNDYLRSWKLPENELTAGNPVTLRKLLTHSAGTTVRGFPGYPWNAAVPTLMQLLDGVAPANTAAVRVDIQPGSRYRYSGGGYEIAQQAVMDVTKMPLPKFMQGAVLRPLGMTHSTFEQPLPQERRGRIAQPHEHDGKPVAGGPHTYPETAAAGLWTTPTDLARYALGVQVALVGKSKVITAARAREMLTPVIENQGIGLQVGGGARQYFTHNGGNQGYRCVLVAYTDGEGAVVMTNAEGGGELMYEVIRTLAHIYEWPDFAPPERVVVAIEPASMIRFVGAYGFEDGATLLVRNSGGRLVSEMPGRPPLVLSPASDREFFARDADVLISFSLDDAGAVESARYRDQGRERTGVRLASSTAEPLLAAAERTAQRVSTQTPAPGSEEQVRHLLADLASGTPDYQRMSPQIAAQTREQLTWLQPWIAGMGALQSLSFNAVEAQGEDVWDATFERDRIRVQIHIGDDGRLIGVTFPPR
jgi:CubicO group peptidase (beta-lactamase class C family)